MEEGNSKRVKWDRSWGGEGNIGGVQREEVAGPLSARLRAV